MKRILSILALFALCFTARAQLFITATLTITNTPGNTDTLTVGSYTFNWTNNTPIGNFAVLYTNNVNTNATNLFTVTGAVLPPVGIFVTQTGTNVLTFQGLNLAASRTAGWASLVLTTNGSASPPAVVSTPISGTPATAAAQTNIMSSLAADLNNLSTNAFTTNAVLMLAYVSTNGKFYGLHIFGIISNAQNISGNVFALTNGYWVNPIFTNAQNFGNPFRSPGGGTGSENFGVLAFAKTNGDTAFGDLAQATGGNSIAIGVNSAASGSTAIALGAGAAASGANSFAVGENTTAQGAGSFALGNGNSALSQNSVAIAGSITTFDSTNSVAIGNGASANFNNSTALGQGAATLAPHQIMLGTSSESTVIPGPLQPNGGISNFATFPSGTYVFNGILTIPSIAIGSLVNSNNVVASGTNSYLQLSGPSGSFCVASISGGVAGRIVTIENASGQTMVIANQSGFDSTSANRIITLTGADINPVNVATLWYDGTASRWKVISSR